MEVSEDIPRDVTILEPQKKAAAVARRQKILNNRESRLKRITGRPVENADAITSFPEAPFRSVNEFSVAAATSNSTTVSGSSINFDVDVNRSGDIDEDQLDPTRSVQRETLRKKVSHRRSTDAGGPLQFIHCSKRSLLIFRLLSLCLIAVLTSLAKFMEYPGAPKLSIFLPFLLLEIFIFSASYLFIQTHSYSQSTSSASSGAQYWFILRTILTLSKFPTGLIDLFQGTINIVYVTFSDIALYFVAFSLSHVVFVILLPLLQS